MQQASTPAAQWQVDRTEDPHQNRYECERAQLTMGKLTDDEIANGAFMNYDVRPPLQHIIDGKAFSPIAWMTAVKDRIRWLSRSLVKEEQKNKHLLDFIKTISSDKRISEDLKSTIDLYLEIQGTKNA